MSCSAAGVPFALELTGDDRDRKSSDYFRLSNTGRGRFRSSNPARTHRGTERNRSRSAHRNIATSHPRQTRRKEKITRYAFINLPYSKRYERIYLAFIAGVAGYGLVPTAALHDPSSRAQIDRIYDLIKRADFSFHDMSWVSRNQRLNMPLELGLAIAIAREPGSNHQWFAFDAEPYRLDKVLSDLGGIRPRVHDFTPEGVLRALMNALAREKHQPTLAELLKIYDEVQRVARRIKRQYSDNLFDARPFRELVLVANEAAHRFIASLSA